MSAIASVVDFPLRRQKKAMTVGALVAFGDGVPSSQVSAARRVHLQFADQLHGSAEAQRHLVIAAVLLNREVFELGGVEKRLDFQL